LQAKLKYENLHAGCTLVQRANRYLSLHINRMLAITYEDDCPPAWRPLHLSQAGLSDEEMARFPCIFCDDFALITEGREIPDDLAGQCQSEGIARVVVYATYDGATDQAVHVGDTYSQAAARTLWGTPCGIWPNWQKPTPRQDYCFFPSAFRAARRSV
jgi:hypothetical protein